MSSGPSKPAEAIVAVLIPPACRAEVVGDLHERFKSPLQYAADALRTVPLVIISRMRRTADPQILLIQAFALYISFLGAAWLKDGAVLRERWGVLRLAIPAAMAMLGLILDDTYANPGRRSALNFARGPLLGLVLALASQGMLWIGNPDLAIPRWIMFYGCAMSLLLSSAVRMLFPPVTGQLLGANAPALWLKQAGVSRGSPQVIIRVLKGITAVVALAIVGTWITERSVPSKAGVVMLLVVLLVAYQISKRS
jgi:hypothetical protein